jgi:hypothetical protein
MAQQPSAALLIMIFLDFERTNPQNQLVDSGLYYCNGFQLNRLYELQIFVTKLFVIAISIAPPNNRNIFEVRCLSKSLLLILPMLNQQLAQR